MKIWINGRLVAPAEAKISVFDRGFMYGDGAFETMRAYAGVVFALDEHLRRVFSALKVLRIKPPYSKERLRGAVYNTLWANKLYSAYIKLIITRGEGRFGLAYKDISMPNVVVIAKNFEGYPEKMYERGISAKITGVQNERSSIAGLKTLNYLPVIMARIHAKEGRFDDAILENTEGKITEGATSNVFFVKKASLITPSPDSGVLPGITRDVIMDIARKSRIRVVEKDVSRRELLGSDEAFFTSSLAEVIPVTRIDSRRIGTGRVGDYTKFFRISYQKHIIRHVLK